MDIAWLDLSMFIVLFFMHIYVVAANKITFFYKIYLGFHFCMMLWPISQVAIRTTDNPEWQLFYAKISFLGLSLLSFGWFLFTLLFINKLSAPRRGLLSLFSIPLLASIVLVLVNPYELFVSPIEGGFRYREYGPLFWVYVAIAYGYLLATAVMMVNALRLSAGSAARKQHVFYLVGLSVLLGFTLIDAVLNVVVYNGRTVIEGLTSMGIVLSDIFYIIAVQKYNVFEIVTLARRDVLDNMATGVVVIDQDDIVLDVNKVSVKQFGIETGQTFHMGEFLAIFAAQRPEPDFLKRYADHPTDHHRIEMTNIRTKRHISIHISPITDGRKTLLGRIITFNDVTELRELVDELSHVNKKLEYMAITDGLTGCYNRRYLHQQLEHEIITNHRYGIPFAIILFDIDYFKRINDTHGHLIGDEVIKQTAEIVRQTLRRSDILARFGGEEFTIYLPHTNMENASILAERIKQNVQNHKLSSPKGSINVTISLGLVSYEGEPMEVVDVKEYLRSLMASADAALYEAKENGRNRIVTASAWSAS